jgi:hypothetical protein
MSALGSENAGQQKILRFMKPIMGGGGGVEKKKFVPLLCAAANFCGQMRTRAVDRKIFFTFSLVLHQNGTTVGCQAF